MPIDNTVTILPRKAHTLLLDEALCREGKPLLIMMTQIDKTILIQDITAKANSYGLDKTIWDKRLHEFGVIYDSIPVISEITHEFLYTHKVSPIMFKELIEDFCSVNEMDFCYFVYAETFKRIYLRGKQS